MNVVYLIGAGINQAVKDWDGNSPPLSNNFFNIALKIRKFKDEHYSTKIQDVYDYIEKCFKKTKNDLAEEPFDLETCFTLLELQIKEAEQKKNSVELRKLATIYFHLKTFLAEVLSEFEMFASDSHVMRNLGRILIHEQPTIITFNYDSLLETILESASRVNTNIPSNFHGRHNLEDEALSDEIIAYSHYNWNRPLGYGIKFDEVQLQQAGISKFVKGKRFYSIPKNILYSKPLLKLHGSLNWFHYLPIRSFPTLLKEGERTLGEKATEIILTEGHWWFSQPPDHDGWLIDPIIITPVLFKDEYYNEKPFKEIWEQAENLSKSKKLVIIGYSFSPTDFSTKRLLIESLIENDLDELVVINPDHTILRTIKEICHYKGGIEWYSNLEDYTNTFSNVIQLECKIEEISEEKLPKDNSPYDVYVKCKTCGIEFPAGIRTNPRSFATSQFYDNVATCPIRHACSYEKKDYILKKVQSEKTQD